MDISSKRFNIQDIGGGLVIVRDNAAPYHCHTVPRADLPTVAQMAAMNESAFDRAVSRAIYR